MSVPPEIHRPVVLDTGVWSHLWTIKTPDDRVGYWRQMLTGRTLVIASQTRAELLSGFYYGRWGHDRMTQVMARLNATPTVPVDEDVIQAYARLFADCKAAGHGLHQPNHSADRWIAATAITIGGELLSTDGIFGGVPGLALIPPGGKD